MEKFIEIKTIGLPMVIWVKEWHDGRLLIDIQGTKYIVTVAFLEESATEWNIRLKEWNKEKYIDNYIVHPQMIQKGFSMDLLWKIMYPTEIEGFLKIVRSLCPKKSFITEMEKKIMDIRKPTPIYNKNHHSFHSDE